jgi:hypothetical protein
MIIKKKLIEREREREREKERERDYLNNMIPEINLFSFFSSSVLNIKYADKVSSPASHQPIKKLKNDSREHPQLGKGVWEREKHLCNLHFMGQIHISL